MKWFKKYAGTLGNYIIGIFMLVVISFFYHDFGSISHISVLLSDLAILGFLAIGQTFPVLTGGIDMSVSYTMCSVAIVINHGMNNYGWNLPIALVIGFLLAFCIGMVNGFGVAYLRVHPMIMTYGMNSILMGMLLTWTNGTSGGNTCELLHKFAKAKLGFVPVVTILFALAVALLMVVLLRTPYGKRLYAVGNCKRAAYFSGIHVRRTIMIAYIISALCVAVGGIIMSGRVGLTYLGMGDSYMFITLAVVAIGGISMNGGSGQVVGTAGGAVIITILLSVLTVLKISTGMQQLLYGVVLLAAIVIEENGQRFRQMRRREKT